MLLQQPPLAQNGAPSVMSLCFAQSPDTAGHGPEGAAPCSVPAAREVGGGICKDFVGLCFSGVEGCGDKDLPTQPHHPLQAGAYHRVKGDPVH